ncbi:TonB-dependent receptor [Pontibacter silvestris]|uniref:TonB-dependent receptor n=1 Tax=Pontibacter silvestris TaxID=2305183 RepID=A0ABW4WWM7_9BACT|nr:TonB-dependent receptor [Pontibacter silvestris]MCC9136943.1 TonB-dependent receptor [Pontibacter silvestris]
MQKIFFSIVFFMVLHHCACAQMASKGTVVDALTKEALAGVSIRLAHAPEQGTLTASDGSFSLTSQTDSDSVVVSYIGYKSLKMPVTPGVLLVQLQPAVNQLNQVIVSASREAQVRTEAPVAISAISKQVINDTKAVSLDQLLNKVSGVYMVNLGNEQHTMAIRQPIGYNSLFLYLEDGIPIRTTGDFNHNALIEINMAALKTIEVIRGPSSSLYGSEAIGGAINFITQASSQVPVARLQAEMSNQGYKRTDFSYSDTYGKLGVYVGGYYAAQRDGYISHSDFDKLALTLRADYRFSENSKLVTSATLVDYQTEQTGGIDSTHFFNKEYSSLHTFTYRKVKALRLRTTLEHQWNAANSTQTTLFLRNNAIAQNPFYAIKSVAGNPLKARGEINEDAFRSYGLISQHRKAFSFLEAQLIGGISLDYSPATYNARFIDVDRNTSGLYTSYTETDSLLTSYSVDLLNTAAYTQFEINPTERLKVVAALRYDRLDYNFNNKLAPSAFTGAPDEKNNFENLTPKVGLTYDFGRNKGTYVNYSVGFAPPQISDLYRGVKVPVLKPSNYTNYEAGGWLSFAQSRGYLDVSVYQLEGRNEIISVRLPDGSYQNQNAGRTNHRGIEYTFKYVPAETIALRISGTNVRHWFKDYELEGADYAGNEMATAPRFMGNAEITYKPLFAKGLRLSLEWQHIGRYYMDAANTEYYNGYDLLNARAGYTLHGVELWVNATNVTNQLYATTVDKYSYGKSYRQGNPRIFNVGVGYTFTGKK